MPESRGSETDAYFDHFRITVSQMGMTYFQSYSIYEQMSDLDNIADAAQEDKDMQSLQKFDVLDEFEIKILVRLKKKPEKVALETQRE